MNTYDEVAERDEALLIARMAYSEALREGADEVEAQTVFDIAFTEALR